MRVDRKLIYSPDVSEMEIDFVIEEGRRYTINRIGFAGNALAAGIRSRAGRRLRSPALVAEVEGDTASGKVQPRKFFVALD